MGSPSRQHAATEIVPREERNPEWLESFLEEPYFTPCHVHTESKNLMKMFCIDCKIGSCSRCLLEFGHIEHKLIEIHQHFKKHVAWTENMETYMNIDGIRTYLSKDRKIIYLRSLNKTAHMHGNDRNTDNSNNNKKRSSSMSRAYLQKGRILCEVCGRGMDTDEVVQYCSIECKLVACMSKSDPSVSPFLAPNSAGEQQPADDVEVAGNEDIQEEPQPPPRKSKRKGFPRRAELSSKTNL